MMLLFRSILGAVRLHLTQEQRQEQRQIMTQRMIQSIDILQLSNIALEKKIEEELNINPFLERSSDIHHADEKNGQAKKNDTESQHRSLETISNQREREKEISSDPEYDAKEFSRADDFAHHYSDTINEAPIRSQNWLEQQDAFRADIFANIEDTRESLQDYLVKQLDWFDLSETLRNKVVRIINNLDSSGYFPYRLEEFFEEDQTGEERLLSRKSLEFVQQLDPRGVGGRDLRECLLLQIDPKSPHAEILRILIESCLEDIAANRIRMISKRLGYSLEAIQDAVSELRHFNPRPGASFESKTAAFVIPDIIIEETKEGKYVARLEDGHIPQIDINYSINDQIKKQEIDRDKKLFIKKKLFSAQWLLDAIKRRRTTLLRVSQAIVDYQSQFFKEGSRALKPLKMQQIADITGMHVTTISRACDKKWVSSPQGVFPLRQLFSSGIAGDGKNDVARDAIHLKLQAIIDNEDKTKPLRDEVIVEMLEAEGVQVARRTVVKYRKMMGIPNSRKRRRWGEGISHDDSDDNDTNETIEDD